MPSYPNPWLLICIVVLEKVNYVFGQFSPPSKPELIVQPSSFQSAGQLKPNQMQQNIYPDLLAQRQYYNGLMSRMLEINKSKSSKSSLNNVDEIKEWKFTDPHNMVDTWAPHSGRWEYLGDWRESDRKSKAAPARAVQRTNIIKYFFRRGILFRPKLDGSNVHRPVHNIPVFHSRPMKLFR
ncbi:uncharacterized protein LOC133183345 [Saccostrea echinata]|uniref:uncharacterized protein LOC133183345 n=1 Tax=Saccostrea echinata TaxID=191078 RepID=UPI002A7EB208|nr:uncharacterized protein LOC133183345 [Saccostrea echinata]